MHIYIPKYMHIHLHLHTYMHIHPNKIPIPTYSNVYAFIHWDSFKYTYVHVCSSVYLHVWYILFGIYIHTSIVIGWFSCTMHIYMNVHTYIHTHQIIQAYMHIHVYMYIYDVYSFIYLHICVHIHLYLHASCIFTYICNIHACSLKYTCIPTQLVVPSYIQYPHSPVFGYIHVYPLVSTT
jgi:hypothetical protein